MAAHEVIFKDLTSSDFIFDATGNMSLNIGAGLSRNAAGEIIAGGSQVTMKRSYVANGSIPNQDVNDNQVLTINDELVESGWTFSAADNAYEYANPAKYIKISAHLNQSIAENANIQRAAPVLILEKQTGAGWDEIARSATGYIRDGSDHEQSSNTITFRDLDTGSGGTYRLSTVQESANAGVVTSQGGDFDLEAFEDIAVISP